MRNDYVIQSGIFYPKVYINENISDKTTSNFVLEETKELIVSYQ